MRTIGIDLAAGAPGTALAEVVWADGRARVTLPVDRAAEGRLFEVYPGGSLRLWGFDTAGYRVDAA